MTSAAPAIPAPSARYCARCGSTLVGEPAACAPCAQRPAPSPAGADAPELTATRTALTVYFALLSVIAVGAIVALVGSLTGGIGDQALVALDIGQTAIFSGVVIAALVCRRPLLPGLATLGQGRWYLAAPLIAAVTFAIATVICGAANRLMGLDDPGYTSMYTDAGYGLWLPLLLVCIQPAIFEEIAFRGIINPALDRVLSPRDSLFVGAFLFAIIHLSFFAFPHLLVMSIALTILRRRSGSLYPCMLLHFCHNGLVVLTEQFPGVLP